MRDVCVCVILRTQYTIYAHILFFATKIIEKNLMNTQAEGETRCKGGMIDVIYTRDNQIMKTLLRVRVDKIFTQHFRFRARCGAQ